MLVQCEYIEANYQESEKSGLPFETGNSRDAGAIAGQGGGYERIGIQDQR